MEYLARIASKRPIAISVIAVMIVVFGLLSWQELELDLFPDIQSPTVMVSVQSGSRPAVEMEKQYGERIEKRLFTVRGLKSIEQVARTGELVTRISFDWDSDVDLALVEVNRAVASIASDIDVDSISVRRFDPRQMPVLVLGLISESGTHDLTELRQLASRQIAPALEQLDNVAEVRVSGGRIKQLQVKVDPILLAAYGLTVGEVNERISEANVDINAGTFVEGDRVLLVKGENSFKTPQDVESVIVSYKKAETGKIVPIRVADIAQVSFEDAEITGLVRVNKREGISLSVFKDGGANTVAVSQVVRDAMKHISKDLSGITISTVTDEASLVEGAIKNVKTAAFWGIFLATAVLILFLRSAGPIFIVAVSIPVSLLATIFALNFAGHSLNLMTLGGLALGTGMLVDNSIVVIESIFRRRSLGDSTIDAAAKGTGIVGGAIATSTLTTCIVFLPVLFIDGIAVKLVSGIAFTVVISLLASLLVAIFLIPALSTWLLPKGKTHDVDPGSQRVEDMVYRLLGKPWKPVLLTLLGSAIAITLLMRLGTELLPPANPEQFSLRVVTPAGQPVESTQRTVAIVESILSLAAGNDLNSMLSEVGRLKSDNGDMMHRQSEENTAEIKVRLNPESIPASKIVDAAAPLINQMHAVDIDWRLNNSALSQALGTDGAAITIEVSGRSLVDIRRAAEEIKDKLSQQQALWNIKTSFEGATPQLRLTLDQTAATAAGVDLQTIANLLEATLDGSTVTSFNEGDEERDVLVKLPSTDVHELMKLTFQSPNGQLVSLGDVTTLHKEPGAREIFRRDQKRIAQVTALPSTDYSAPQVRTAALNALTQTQLPIGIDAKIAGEEIERVQSINELLWAAALALMLVFMVLAGSFESLLQPLTILFSIPIALIGVTFVLFPIGHPLGIMSMLGFIILVGIAVNDAILLTQMARSLIQEGMQRRAALAKAASLRLRPIIMTTATTVLALLPLAIGSGDAAQLRGPLAWTVIGGIIASTISSLTIVPCVYMILDNFSISSMWSSLRISRSEKTCSQEVS